MRYTNEDIKRRANLEKWLKLFIKILVYIIILPVTIFNITMLVKSYISPNETPSFFGIKTYDVISGSMQPELKVGDIIVVKSIEKEKLKVGDIISFRQNDSIITHRIFNIVDDGVYETKGDYNNSVDSNLVEYENIEGKILFSIPYLGKVVFLLRNKIVIIVIIILLYLIYMHNLKLQTKREIRKEKRKNLNIKR